MSKRGEWTEKELGALEEDAQWDWDTFEERAPTPLRAVRFVVSLPLAEARELARAARAAGLTELEYLRVAALEKARAGASTPRQ